MQRKPRAFCAHFAAMPTPTDSSASRVLGYTLGALALLFLVVAIPAPAPTLDDAPVRARLAGLSLARASVDLYARMRETVKLQSAAWDVNALDARDRLYRALYGGRRSRW